MIDWTRAAAPQEDQYDTLLALYFAAITASPQRPLPYVRAPVGDAPTIFDDAVAVRYINADCPGAPLLNHGPLDHPNIGVAVEYVRRWPLAFEQFKMLMHSFHPMIKLDTAEADYREGLGSYSHSDEPRLGSMYGTFYDPLGLAQAFVHEMAHNKLRALGVQIDSALRIVANAPDELYVSPVIKDRLRPMTAVLHAEYSFAYVTALDLEMIRHESSEPRLRILLRFLERNLRRIEEGIGEIRQHARLDEVGIPFMAGLYAWIERLVDDSHDVLRRYKTKGIVPDDELIRRSA
jgi:hypothetical protein